MSAISKMKLVDRKVDAENSTTFQHLRSTILESLSAQVKEQMTDFFKSIKEDLNKSIAASCAELAFNADKPSSNADTADVASNSNQNNDKIECMRSESDARISLLEEEITKLTKEIQDVSTNLDGQIALNLERDETTKNRVTTLEKCCGEMKEDIDSVEQQGRKETVEFHNLPFQYDKQQH